MNFTTLIFLSLSVCLFYFSMICHAGVNPATNLEKGWVAVPATCNAPISPQDERPGSCPPINEDDRQCFQCFDQCTCDGNCAELGTKCCPTRGCGNECTKNITYYNGWKAPSS